MDRGNKLKNNESRLRKILPKSGYFSEKYKKVRHFFPSYFVYVVQQF